MGAPQGVKKPALWKYPHDELKTIKHMAYLRAKAQCHFRGEGWEITPDEWQDEIWPNELWTKRGRSGQDYCMIRDDPKEPWSKWNVMIVTRRVQLVIQKYVPELVQLPNGVWDITGEALKKWEINQVKMAPYRGRYKKKPKERGL